MKPYPNLTTMDSYYKHWHSQFVPRKEMKLDPVMNPVVDDHKHLLSVNYDPREGMPITVVDRKTLRHGGACIFI